VSEGTFPLGRGQIMFVDWLHDGAVAQLLQFNEDCCFSVVAKLLDALLQIALIAKHNRGCLSTTYFAVCPQIPRDVTVKLGETP
jgi:hypothetical protein